jgi:hypothetical protein
MIALRAPEAVDFFGLEDVKAETFGRRRYFLL